MAFFGLVAQGFKCRRTYGYIVRTQEMIHLAFPQNLPLPQSKRRLPALLGPLPPYRRTTNLGCKALRLTTRRHVLPCV